MSELLQALHDNLNSVEFNSMSYILPFYHEFTLNLDQSHIAAHNCKIKEEMYDNIISLLTYSCINYLSHYLYHDTCLTYRVHLVLLVVSHPIDLEGAMFLMPFTYLSTKFGAVIDISFLCIRICMITCNCRHSTCTMHQFCLIQIIWTFRY